MEPKISVEPINQWKAWKRRPLVVAGPCSAENEEQVMHTAQALAATKKVDVFRAGIWKPRTRPGTFEGRGVAGLRWLATVKKETGLPVATEVANARHVYEALKYGIDHLWIGARSTANPFVVQEIADALQGSDVTVMIKNPVNPDLELWVGAIERIQKAGIIRIGAIHRGFSNYEKTRYRNVPHWLIPADLKQRIPNLPVICDPSHICGNRHMLMEVSQKAMDLNFDGLMIESHIDPAAALSDAQQQLTPQDLLQLLDKLVMRQPETDDARFLDRLEALRKKIDIFDEQLLDILDKRMRVARAIAHCKKENNVTVLQSRRWAEVVRRNVAIGEAKGLGAAFIETLFRAVHQESINQQTRIMNEELKSENPLETAE
jgi:3-deoxy-7-phosphoheptulonate synthase